MAALMGKMIFESLPGATPLNPDESAGLIPRHITTQSQLNEWEQNNILDAEAKIKSKKIHTLQENIKKLNASTT